MFAKGKNQEQIRRKLLEAVLCSDQRQQVELKECSGLLLYQSNDMVVTERECV